MSPDIGVIIQARISSTRLHGKILKPFYKGQSILGIQIEKLKSLGLPVILATTENLSDDVLADFAIANDIHLFRGDEENVLSRFIDCARKYSFKTLIRVCSDNPFLNEQSIINLLDSSENIDYVCFKNKHGISAIRTHWGLFAEVIKLEALERVALMNKNPFYNEHVTNYVYEHPHQFRVNLLDAPKPIFSRDDLRFTVDTLNDFENMQVLYQKMLASNRTFTLENLVLAVDENPEIREIMLKGIESFSK